MRSFLAIALLLPLFAHSEIRPLAECGSLAAATDIPSEDALKFLQSLKRAAGAGDKTAMAKLFRYPVLVNARLVDKSDLSKMTPMVSKEIKSAAQLERNYSTLFPPETLRLIQAQSETHLRCLGGAARIGHGELWFKQEPKGAEIRIVTINLDQDGLEILP